MHSRPRGRTGLNTSVQHGKMRHVGCARYSAWQTMTSLAVAGVRHEMGAAMDSDWIGTAFDIDGPDEGEPVLLLHGFAADRTAWAALRQGLRRTGFRVLTPDLPAHGAATAEASTPDGLADGLAPLVRATFGDTAPHVIAHSLGCAAALSLQRQVSLASLTLIAPAGVGRHIDADFIRGIAAPASPERVRELLARLTTATMPFSDVAIAALHETLSRGRLTALADTLLNGDEQALDLAPAIVAAAAELPLRIVIGHRDAILDWRAVTSVSARIALHHLPDAGHVPHWDAPREVQAIVLDALRGAVGNRLL